MKNIISVIATFIFAFFVMVDYFYDEGEFVIPTSVKLVAGTVLFVLGIVHILDSMKNSENKKQAVITEEDEKRNKKQLKIILIFLILGVIGSIFFFIQKSNSDDKHKGITQGTFVIVLDKKTCFGKASLSEGETLTLQIAGIPENGRIRDFKLFVKDVVIAEDAIRMPCALTQDFQVKWCSTQMDIDQGFQMFIDKNYYTIAFELRKPLENTKVCDISFVVSTDSGEQKILIAEN